MNVPWRAEPCAGERGTVGQGLRTKGYDREGENAGRRDAVPNPLSNPRKRHHGVSVLDTANADAERLYARLGWQRCGVIPGYALLPAGGLCGTTYFYRQLVAAS